MGDTKWLFIETDQLLTDNDISKVNKITGNIDEVQSAEMQKMLKLILENLHTTRPKRKHSEDKLSASFIECTVSKKVKCYLQRIQNHFQI